MLLRRVGCAFLLCAGALLSACQSSSLALPAWQEPRGRDSSELGQIIETASGRVLSPAELVSALAPAPLVIIGEKHDNADHHALQQWLLRSLSARRAQGSWLLEMLNPDQQAAVTAAQQRLAKGERLDNLPKQIHWQKNWPWHLYGPLVSEALAQPYPLRSANLDRSEIIALYRKPPQLPAGLSTAKTVQQALIEDIRQAHCGKLPDSQVPPMLAIQQQRDRRMAERLLAAPQPAVLLAGAFHARRDLGVPLHTQDLAGQQPKVLILLEVGQTVPKDAADYLWYSPATAAKDYCQDL